MRTSVCERKVNVRIIMANTFGQFTFLILGWVLSRTNALREEYIKIVTHLKTLFAFNFEQHLIAVAIDEIKIAAFPKSINEQSWRFLGPFISFV